MSAIHHAFLMCSLSAVLIAGGGQTTQAAIFVETWQAENIGDTIDGTGDAGLADWEKTYGNTYEPNCRIFSTAGDHALRLNPNSTYPLGITTTNGFPSESVAGLFSIRADIRIESDGTTGAANIMATQSDDVFVGYMLNLDPQTGTINLVRSDSAASQTVLSTHNAGGHNFFISHTYQLRGRLVPFVPQDYLFLEVFIDGDDNRLFYATDMDPIEFGPYIKGGMLTTGGRSAVFDDCVAAIAVPGDTTGDLQVTMADLALFTETLLDPEGASYYLRCACDVNEDAVANGDDIHVFVDMLTE